MKYSEHRPPAFLAPFVECLWHACDEGASDSRPAERILPDGCIEWIFHFGEPFQRLADDGRVERQPVSFLVGEMTRHMVLRPAGRVETMGVRFRPGGAYPFLPLPLDTITNLSLKTALLFGREGQLLEDALLDARGEEARRSLVEAFLLRRLARAPGTRPRLEGAVRVLLARRGRGTVAQVAAHVGWSPRQLEREFRRGVGLSPKALARILRFQNVLRLLGRPPRRSWADLAAACGYADQAHLNREFRELSGATPTQGAASGDLARNFIAPDRLDLLLRPPDVAFLQDGAAALP